MTLVEETLVEETLATPMFVPDAPVKESCGKSPYPVTEMFVPDAVPMEEEEMLTTPVEVEIVKSADDVAPPPSRPKRIWESTPDESAKAEGVEVLYLLPLTSKRFVI